MLELPQDFAKHFPVIYQKDSIDMLTKVLEQFKIRSLSSKSPKIKDCIQWTYSEAASIDGEVLRTNIDSNWILSLMDGTSYFINISEFRGNNHHVDSLARYLYLTSMRNAVEKKLY